MTKRKRHPPIKPWNPVGTRWCCDDARTGNEYFVESVKELNGAKWYTLRVTVGRMLGTTVGEQCIVEEAWFRKRGIEVRA